jgi:hypothetical protein
MRVRLITVALFAAIAVATGGTAATNPHRDTRKGGLR